MAFNFAELNQFTGSENWYRHALNRSVLFTDGVKYLADQVGAYWLLDEIALAQLGVGAVRAESFQAWTLTVPGSRATLTCGNGSGLPVYANDLPFTDFPPCGVTLWFTDNVILLPSE